MNPLRPLLAVVIVIALSTGVAAAGDVNINVGFPPPPPIIVAKPSVVVVPETRVYRAPTLDFNVFMFGGKYDSLHNDHWFMSVKVGAPWTPVVVERVPVEVRTVPVKYYKVPPGHAKKTKKERDDDDDQGKGHSNGCPPGQAKKGRC
jgi:hypothetical protein